MNSSDSLGASQSKIIYSHEEFTKRMECNPHLFIIIRAKIRYAKNAVQHLKTNNDQQEALSVSHPDLYERTVHAESMAANIQGICNKIGGILRSLAYAMDGYIPDDKTSNRDILLQISVPMMYRKEIIRKETSQGLIQLLNYRDDLLKSFAVNLSSNDVFANVKLMGQGSAQVFSDLEFFIESTEKDLAGQG